MAGADPHINGLYIAAGFNGHGVMHSPAITRAVAELIAQGKATTFDLYRVRPERFSNGEFNLTPALHLL